MATQKQIEANRLNAKKSTGPRTAAGKSVSSRNAVKKDEFADFGKGTFITGESSPEFDALRAEYWDSLAPTGIQERFLVEDMLWSEWRRRCYSRWETAIWKRHWNDELRANNPGPKPANTANLIADKRLLGAVFNRAASDLDIVERLVEAAEKRYDVALKRLSSLRARSGEQPQKVSARPFIVSGRR